MAASLEVFRKLTIIVSGGNMSIKKQFLKTRPVCKVTFRLSEEEVKNAAKVNLVGDFNNWNTKQMPMKKLKNGSFTVTIDFDKNCDYQFRYLVDNKKWINDSEADHYVPSGYVGSKNSVVSV
jgi:1,4-alpha-glucan branching enzyme